MLQRDLRRLYANCGETKKPEEAVIEGKVPEWLNGTYLKVGKCFMAFSWNHYLNFVLGLHKKLSRWTYIVSTKLKFYPILEDDILKSFFSELRSGEVPFWWIFYETFYRRIFQYCKSFCITKPHLRHFIVKPKILPYQLKLDCVYIAYISVQLRCKNFMFQAKFEIYNGSKVVFQKKYLETDVVKRADNAQKAVVCEYGTPAQPDPTKGFLSRCIPNLVI